MSHTHTQRLIKFVVITFASLAVQQQSFSQVQSWITNPSNGHLYGLTTNFYYGIQDEHALSNQPTWLNAQSLAQSLNGNLVTINDATENAWIFNTFGYQQLLIGFSDYGSEGNWSWISGEPVTYTNWMPGQPDNGGIVYNGNDVAHLNAAAPELTQFLGMWNDIGNDTHSTHPSIVSPMRALVEIVPEPSLCVSLLVVCIAVCFLCKSGLLKRTIALPAILLLSQSLSANEITFNHNFNLFGNWNQYLHSVSNAEVYHEQFAGNSTFWRPTINNVEGSVIYRFPVGQTIQSANLRAGIVAFTSGDNVNFVPNYDPNAYVYLDVSIDGVSWSSVDGRYPGNGGYGGYGSLSPPSTGNGDITALVSGGSELYVRARLFDTTNWPGDGPIFAQFLRTNPGQTSPSFELQIVSIPEPQSLISVVAALVVIGLAYRRTLRMNARNYTRLFIYGLTASICLNAELHAANLTIETDTSWRAISPAGNQEGTPIGSVGIAWENANSGWNSSLLYDDSDLNSWHYSLQWPSDPNWNFIWSEGPVYYGATPSYFRKEFMINGTPTGGLLDYYVDDDAQIYLNGYLVVNDVNNTASTQDSIDISAYLQNGMNLLAIKAHDSYPFAPPGINSEGIAIRLNAQITAVPEPSAFVIGALALVFVAWFHKNHRIVSAVTK